MKFGTSIWTFKWDPPFEEVIPRIARLGYKALELIAWDDHDFGYYTDEKINELKIIIDSEGLELSEFASKAVGMGSSDQNKQKKAIDNFKKQVEVGKKLGTKIVNTVSDFPFALDIPLMSIIPQLQEFNFEVPSGLDWKKNWEDYVEVVRLCTLISEDAGMKYAIEPHPYMLVSNTASMLRLFDHIESDTLGINFDVSHIFPSGEVPHIAVYQLGKKILHTHFSDNDGLTNVHWRPGKGKIDWAALLRALHNIGYDGVISLEIEDAVGVSRGRIYPHGVYRGHTVATEEFDDENKVALRFLYDICEREGITVEK